jgi:esterase/lipase superfamily enzyme
VSLAEGVWPLSIWRCDRRYGDPGFELFPRHTPLNEADESVWNAARQMRVLCYSRVTSACHAVKLLQQEVEIRLSLEITRDWYDPQGGVLPELGDAVFTGSHAVPILAYDPAKGCFVFCNSWGRDWGDRGFGYLPFQNYDRSVIEAWYLVARGMDAPYQLKDGIACREWKWSLTPAFGVHGREIVDVATRDRLAWAFCVRRGRFLDVDEFFVWPSERRKGYGRHLANMVSTLASDMRLPIRAWVSFADTGESDLSGVNATMRLLGLELERSPERWASHVGWKHPSGVIAARSRPERPASVLEWLRPRDEAPLESPSQFTIYYGTNRKLVGGGVGGHTFSNSRGERLSIGSCLVTVPKTHRFGGAGRTFVKRWMRGTGTRLRVEETTVEDNIEFINHVKEAISQVDDERQNLLYVHGYNVSFSEAARRAAQLGFDLKIPGATFFFSWPSAARLNAYAADEAAIEASLPYLEQFILLLAIQCAEVPMNIIAHSMGNRAVLRLLERLNTADSPLPTAWIKNLILAAPDVDSDVFVKSMTKSAMVPKRTTLYVTCGDWALQASEWLHQFPRAGLMPPVTTIPDVDTVLVEDFDLLELGHDYFSEACAVLHDIFDVIRRGSPPGDRPRTIAAKSESGAEYWRLPVR